MERVVDALQVHRRHAERIAYTSLGKCHREPHPIKRRVESNKERARFGCDRLSRRAHPLRKLPHSFNPVDAVSLQV